MSLSKSFLDASINQIANYLKECNDPKAKELLDNTITILKGMDSVISLDIDHEKLKVRNEFSSKELSKLGSFVS